MNIKRMMAGFTVAVLMLGTLSTTCFAASAENDDSKTKPAAVTEGAATDTANTEEEQLPYEMNVDEDAGRYSRPGFATVVHVVVGASFTEHPCRLKEAFGPVGISAAVVAQGQRRVHLVRIVAAKHVFAGIVVGYVGERVGVTHIVDFRRSVRRSVHGFHGNI